MDNKLPNWADNLLQAEFTSFAIGESDVFYDSAKNRFANIPSDEKTIDADIMILKEITENFSNHTCFYAMAMLKEYKNPEHTKKIVENALLLVPDICAKNACDADRLARILKKACGNSLRLSRKVDKVILSNFRSGYKAYDNLICERVDRVRKAVQLHTCNI